MSYGFDNLKSKTTSLQVRNQGTTSSASTTGTTASTDDVTADSFQSLASLQDSDAAEKRRLYTKHKRHLSMSRDKIIQASRVKRPTSTPLVSLEPETSHEGEPRDAQNSDNANKSNSVLFSAVRNRVRSGDLSSALKLKIPAKGSTPDVSPSSTPGCYSPLTPGIAGAIALSRARSCSMVELFNQEGKQVKFQKSTFDVELLKKPGGKKLGFTVVGGLDTPGRPMGIYVKTVQPGGLAAEEGTLKQGDEILEVNGVTFTGMIHQEAVSAFRKLKKGTIRINIRRFIPVAQTRKDSLDEGVSVTSVPMSPSCEGGSWRHPLERRRSSNDVLNYSQHEADENGVGLGREKKEAPISKSENYSEFVRSTEHSAPSTTAPSSSSVVDLPSLEKVENSEQVVITTTTTEEEESRSSPADGLANNSSSCPTQEPLKPVNQRAVNNDSGTASFPVSNHAFSQHKSNDVELEWGPISDDISDLIIQSFDPSSPDPPPPPPLSPRKRGMPHGLRPRRPSTPRFMESQGSDEDGSDKEQRETAVREFMSETTFVPVEKDDALLKEDVESPPPPPVFDSGSSLATSATLEGLPDEKRSRKEDESRDISSRDLSSRDLSSRETVLSEYEDVFADDAVVSESRTSSSMTSFGDHVTTAARRSTTTTLPQDRLPDSSPEIANMTSKVSQSDNAIVETTVEDPLLQVQSLDSSTVLPSAGLGDQGGYAALDPKEGSTFDQEMMTTILEEPEECVTTMSGNNLLRRDSSNFAEEEPSNQDGISISPDRDISAVYHDNMTSIRVKPVNADSENVTDDVTLNDDLTCETSGSYHLEEERQETVMMTKLETNGANENSDFTEQSVDSESRGLELQEDVKTSETDDKEPDSAKKNEPDEICNSESSQLPVIASSENADLETQERSVTESLEFQAPSSERESLSDGTMPGESSDRKSDSFLAERTRRGLSNSFSAEDDVHLFRPERFLELILEPITPEATDTASSASTCIQPEPSRQEYPGESDNLSNASNSSLIDGYHAGLRVSEIPNGFQLKYSQDIESSCSNEASITGSGVNDDAKGGMPGDSIVKDELQDFKKQRERNSSNFSTQNDLNFNIRTQNDEKRLAVSPPQEDTEDSENIDINAIASSDFFLTSEMIDISSPNSKSENSYPFRPIADEEGEVEGSSENLNRETAVETHTAGEKQNVSKMENADVFPDDATTPLTTTDPGSNLDFDESTLTNKSTRPNAGLIRSETDYLTSKPNRDFALSLKPKNDLTDANHLKDKPGYLNQESTIVEEHKNFSSKNRSDFLASSDFSPENRLQDSVDLKPFESALEPDRNETQLSSAMLSKGSYGNEDPSNVLASHDLESLPRVSLLPDNLDNNSKSGAKNVRENCPTVLMGANQANSTKHQLRTTSDRQSGTELSFFALDIKDVFLPQTGDVNVSSNDLDSIPPLPASKPPLVEDCTFFQTADDVTDKITQNLDSAVSVSTDFNDNEIVVNPSDGLLPSTVDANGDSLLPHGERQELFTNFIRVSCDSRGLGGDISGEENSTKTFDDEHGAEDKRGRYAQGTDAPPPPRQKLAIRFLQGSEGNIHWNVDRTEERQIHSHSEERSSIQYQISSPSKDSSLDLGGGEDCLMGKEGQDQDPNSVPIAILSWCSTNPSSGSSHPVSSVD